MTESMFKKFIIFLCVVLIGGGIYLAINFSDLSKNAVEKVASQALGVSVKISSLDLSLDEKKVTVSNIRIANPSGYKKSYAVEIGSIAIALSEVPHNFDLIKFKLVEVQNAVVNLEVSDKSTNLKDLKNNMPSSGSASDSDQSKVSLEKFTINASTLNPSVTLINTDLSPVTIPPVTLRGIGTKSNGVLAKDAIKQIMTAYLDTAMSQAGSAGYLAGLPNINVEAEIDAVKTKAMDKINDKVKSLGGLLGN